MRTIILTCLTCLAGIFPALADTASSKPTDDTDAGAWFMWVLSGPRINGRIAHPFVAGRYGSEAECKMAAPKLIQNEVSGYSCSRVDTPSREDDEYKMVRGRLTAIPNGVDAFPNSVPWICRILSTTLTSVGCAQTPGRVASCSLAPKGAEPKKSRSGRECGEFNTKAGCYRACAYQQRENGAVNVGHLHLWVLSDIHVGDSRHNAIETFERRDFCEIRAEREQREHPSTFECFPIVHTITTRSRCICAPSKK
jgi:hypothetical protein